MSKKTNEDYEKRFWKATDVLINVLEKNDSVWEARCISDTEVLGEISKNGFIDDYTPIEVSINDKWIYECGYKAYITPYEDFVRIIFVSENDGVSRTWEYSWNGEYLRGFRDKLEEFISGRMVDKIEDAETTPPTNSSESNYDKYKDKTVRDVRNEYGQEKESWVENCRKVLIYDNPSVPHFYYTFHLGSGEEAFKSLQREPVAPSNMHITGFVASNYGTEVYKGIKIGDNFDNAMSLLGAITEKRDSLSATSYPHGGQIDWILDRGTIIYASVIYGH